MCPVSFDLHDMRLRGTLQCVVCWVTNLTNYEGKANIRLGNSSATADKAGEGRKNR
jgi:hypothetical protein